MALSWLAVLASAAFAADQMRRYHARRAEWQRRRRLAQRMDRERVERERRWASVADDVRCAMLAMATRRS